MKVESNNNSTDTYANTRFRCKAVTKYGDAKVSSWQICVCMSVKLVPARHSRAGASDSDRGVDDGVSIDINSVYLYPSCANPHTPVCGSQSELETVPTVEQAADAKRAAQRRQRQQKCRSGGSGG